MFSDESLRMDEGGGAMAIRINCKELGMDCPFETKGETEEAVLDSVMRHLHDDHREKAEDWFEIEEIYDTACSIIRRKAS